MMTKKAILIPSFAFILRIVLFNIPTIADTLAARVEVVTPITSFKRLTEGLYLYENSVPPYDNGIFHQAPFLLVLFSALTSLSPLAIPIAYAAVDTFIGYALVGITQMKQRNYANAPMLEVEKAMSPIDPWTVAALYLFNPLTIFSCVSKSTLIFTNLSVVLSVALALKGDAIYSMFWVAVASYLSFYPAMIMPALVLIISNWTPSNNSTLMKQARASTFYFVAWLALFLVSSRILVGSWDYLYSTYGTILCLTDLTPNVGMFWYFFIEMFDQFRNFFLVVFQLHAFIFVAPLCIKIREHPIFVIIVLSGIMSILKSYPSVGDAALFLGLLPVHDELFKYARYGFLVTNLYLYSAALAPIFWHLWIYAGSGNANFFYAITLVYNLGQVLLLIDIVYAVLRRSYDIANPHTIGKEVVHK
ncbi:GPI transamidase subunit PIG-U [Umbelopsis sp. AD052]|nr:GPI transamidase subunit PIG-U [Umbelopsis sp. AD052]